MAIEVRFDPDGKGIVAIPCVHCGADIEDVEEGVAVWMPARKPHIGEHYVFAVDYAHEDCEDSFLERRVSPDAMKVANKTNTPLGEFFDMLRES